MFRKLFFWIHKWLGLITGLIVLIVSLTGCLTVFSDELKACFYHDRYYITPATHAEMIGFSRLKNIAQESLGPGVKISRAEIYPHQNRSWVFRASLTDKKAIGYWNQYKYYFRVYVNPYNGKVIHVENTKKEFFQVMLNLHMNLLLGDALGTTLTGISVLCFFILLISGFIIWFPRKWRMRAFKRGLIFKSGVGLKRLNFDLHNILGFYIFIPAMLITVTGLVFAFPWADTTVQFLANGAKTVKKREIPKSTANEIYPVTATDAVVAGLLKQYPQADVFSIRFREKDTDPLDVQVRLAENRTHLFEWYYFDRNTGKLLMRYNDRNVNSGEKFRSMNYDLHTGAFAGIPTKIFAFIVSLICAAMPITGFIMWYNKLKPKKKRK